MGDNHEFLRRHRHKVPNRIFRRYLLDGGGGSSKISVWVYALASNEIVQEGLLCNLKIESGKDSSSSVMQKKKKAKNAAVKTYVSIPAPKPPPHRSSGQIFLVKSFIEAVKSQIVVEWQPEICCLS